MTAESPSGPSGKPATPESKEAKAFVSELISNLSPSDTFDAQSVLNRYPDLKEVHSVVIDVVYEEYCRRQDAGESVNVEQFANRFPDVRDDVVQQIRAHDMLVKFASERAPVTFDQPKVGQEFLGFLLREELGSGGFSDVFAAIEVSLPDRSVVVKLCKNGQGAEEAKTIAKLAHPHVVPIFSTKLDRENGITVICMPFLSRATLQDVCQRAHRDGSIPRESDFILSAVADANLNPAIPLPDPKSDAQHGIPTSYTYDEGIIHIGWQLADALAYTHEQKIYHCDVKPSNILLSQSGHALLFDFNLAFAESVENAKIGGTLPYMAPEQLRLIISKDKERPEAIGAKTDLFAFGVTIYQVLTGRLPFGEVPTYDSRTEIAQEMLDRQLREPLPISDYNPNVDKKLVSLIEQCLKFDVAQRPTSASEVADQLNQMLSRYSRGVRRMRRHPKMAIFVGSAILATTISGAVIWANLDPPSIRAYQQGIQAFAEDDFGRAVPLFTQSLEYDPANYDAMYARARTRLRLNTIEAYNDALTDFRKVLAFARDTGLDGRTQGRIQANIAYCQAMIVELGGTYEQFNYSVSMHKQAIAHFQTAELLNNLGYCHYRRKFYSDAKEAYEQALAMDANLLPAQHGILVSEQQITIGKRHLTDLEFAEELLADSNSSPVIYQDVARLYALNARRCEESDNQLGLKNARKRVIELSREMVKLGVDFEFIREFVTSNCKSITSHPQFLALQSLAIGNDVPESPFPLIDPLAQDPSSLILQLPIPSKR